MPLAIQVEVLMEVFFDWQVAISKAIASLVKYKAGGEGLKALQTIRIYVNNALIVRVVLSR